MIFIKKSRIKRSSRELITKLLIATLCFCLWTSQAAAAEGPEAVVESGTNQTIQLLKEYSGNPPLLKSKVWAVVDKYFDFHTIAMNVLGPQWRRQPPEKLNEFIREFSRFLFNTYISRIENYSDQKFQYSLRQKEGNFAAVEALVTGGQTPPTPIVYYLHLNRGNWQVYDVQIAGVSLVGNYRAQIDSILSRTSFDGLLEQLKSKIG